MKCAVYIRVSTHKEEQKSSLSNQKELFYNFISQKGWSVYSFYVDVETGTSDKRDGLQQLINDAKNRKFDMILAKELSRLARNGGLSYQIKDLAERNHIHILTLDNAINTLEKNNVMLGLYAWMYEQESQRTSERIKYSLQSRARKGLFKGSVAPLGYEVLDGKLHIRNDESPHIVRRIFKEYLQGKGFVAIARTLYNDGHVSPAVLAGKANGSDKWHGSSVRNILTNPHYVGDLVQGRDTTRSVTSKVREPLPPEKYIVIKDAHDAIISREDFVAVQSMIESRKRHRPYAEIHLFTNTLRCADCNKGMHFKKNRRGYICGSFNKHGIKACTDHHIIEEDLIKALLSDISRLTSELNHESLLSRLELKIKNQIKQLEKELHAVNTKINNLGKQKTKYIQLLASEVITQEDYRDVVKDNEETLKDLLKAKMDIEKKHSKSDAYEQINKLKKELHHFINIDTLSPELLHRLVERIEIKADGTARIFYRFSLPSAII